MGKTFLKVKAGENGSVFDFEGRLGQQGVIEAFVELHYTLYGEITPAVLALIEKHSKTLKYEVNPAIRKELGVR